MASIFRFLWGQVVLTSFNIGGLAFVGMDQKVIVDEIMANTIRETKPE